MMTRTAQLALSLALLLATTSGPALAATLRVGDGGAFQTIAAALKAARTGDVVEIASGTYAESLVIKKKLTLAGVDSGGGIPVLSPHSGPALQLKGGHAVVENLAIQGHETPATAFTVADLVDKDAGIVIESDGNSLRKVSVRGMRNGVLVYGKGNEITGSDISANAVSGLGVRSGSETAVRQSRFEGNGFYGLYLGWINDPALATGDYADWYKVLMTLKPVEHSEVSGSQFIGNGMSGLVLAQAAFKNTVRDNVMEGNGGKVSLPDTVWYKGSGIYLSCGAMNNLIASNQVTGNDAIGINVTSAVDNRFSQNTVTGNSEIGINISSSTGNRFDANQVSGHKDYGIVARRWADYIMPNSGQHFVGNDLTGNGVNAYDDSGIPFEFPKEVKFVDQAARDRAYAELSPANLWDDGRRGNHYDDFDETAEGFADADGDGVGEMAHPIPGGAAVDHHPLAGIDGNRQGLLTNGVTGPDLAAVEP
jgi:parallel beta-helix repeat protein